MGGKWQTVVFIIVIIVLAILATFGASFMTQVLGG